jgi:hypothetical protein
MTATWQAVVAGEDAAVFAIGVAGARLTGAERQTARRQLTAHQDARDRAAALVRASGGEPPPPEVAYALPFPVRTAASARRLLALVENRLVPVYADAAADSVDADRRYAARTAARCATRAVEWGAPSQAFPTGG